jgi:hypothetical protein
LEIKILDSSHLELYFKITKKASGAEIETQEVALDPSEGDIKKIHRKLVQICQPKGLQRKPTKLVPATGPIPLIEYVPHSFLFFSGEGFFFGCGKSETTWVISHSLCFYKRQRTFQTVLRVRITY